MALNPPALTDAIEAAFEKEWPKFNTRPLPAAGRMDRRLIFAAVARGLLEYLEAHEDELFNTITIQEASGASVVRDVDAVDLNIETNP